MRKPRYGNLSETPPPPIPSRGILEILPHRGEGIHLPEDSTPPWSLRVMITNPKLAPKLFSLEVCHNGFFCGLAEKLSYVDDTISVFDNLLIDSWNNSTLDHILCVLDCLRDEKVHVYWLSPGKDLFDGLVPLLTDDDLIDMRREAKVHKTLVIFVDHTNFIRLIRADLVRARAAIARVGNDVELSEEAASTSIVVAQDLGQECVQSCADDSDSDSSTDSEFFDSDYDAESGDDDLFLDNVDTDLHDNNEIVLAPDLEDDSQLEDRDLNLEEGERLQLEYKFAAFNPVVDMESPVFKIGMKFASIEEARQAVNAYNIRERVKTRKTKNDRTRLHARCEEGCPWRLKIGFDLQRGKDRINKGENLQAPGHAATRFAAARPAAHSSPPPQLVTTLYPARPSASPLVQLAAQRLS
ncbi:hypothetical protein QYE76_069353 [Lolium multiflorum]|uniref:Transposase MuDR plant domain-containing protein n=1 Tax=Lolium multiflorum TaxID=4521 RepID=A0AAD8SH84_LOLMU|nr:hypothetical protein QYE76_069353 [Lolium multiflorum]